MGAALTLVTLPFRACCLGYSCLSCCCTGSMGAGGLKPWQAKLFYVFFLGFGTLLGFLFSKYAAKAAEGDFDILDNAIFEFSIDCIEESCNGNPAILRTSFASVLFFGLMLVGTIPVPTVSGNDHWRPLLGEGFHRGFWGLKFLVYFGLIIGAFFIPFNDNAYIGVARFVSMIFLILQVLVLVDFAYIWNDTWVERSDVENDFADGSKGWLIALLSISFLLFAAGFGGMIAILALYTGCSATLGITSFNLILGVAGTALTLLKDKFIDDEVSGSIAPPAVVVAYLGYLAFSATMSNPVLNESCDPFNNKLGQSAADIFLSIAIATVSLIWMALTVSGNATSLLGGSDEKQGPADVGGAYEIQEADGTTKYAREVDHVPGEDKDDDSGNDKLWFFHAIMITASFYMAMVLTNWGVSEEEVAAQGAQIGNISMYVKAAAGWAAGLLFIWTIVAPYFLPDRDWS